MKPQAIALATTRETRAARVRVALTGLAIGAAVALTQALPAEAQDRPMSFADLAEMVSPSVVNITTSTMVSGRTGPQGIVPEGSPFEDFFNNMPDGDSPRRSSALGSGFVISADGYIVTNNHVIEGADEILIEFFDRDTEWPAEVVGTDPNTDIALLKVEVPEGETLSFVQFGDSDGETAEVGDWVMAMGNPLGQGFSVSAGIISARNRALSGTYDDYIQTDAAINRGNSGGPLFDMDGDVIGVNTAILSPTGGSIGIGFAMSSGVVNNVVEQLAEFGETRRGWLGVRIQDVTPDMVDAIDGLADAQGALVTDVPPGPAEDAGMLSGDVIVVFDGQDVADTRELVRIVGNSPVGKEVAVDVLREGEMTELTVVLGRRETAEASMPAPQESPEEAMPEESVVLGLTLSESSDELMEQYGLEIEEGLVITDIDPMSEAASKGLLPGDVITEAGQQQVASVDQFRDRIDEARDAGRKSLLLLVRRGGDPRFVALSLVEETPEADDE
ncbi:Do family serine endopeptidase [Roseisalinus antarcticus]|uniref:Putative periplasmic serine endoprotease DegP-like n=1 Tax=Roseisalinus antarcticus TaxID=254357 RepID=A0A1Y5SHV2_9RHOB|nr:Do family serine endopeptidase [Roseisalinus antarcticus]SLN40481.1 putative periplasmic serine endoprotease DegP-like precursor [Roseisalinus antarcticus]